MTNEEISHKLHSELGEINRHTVKKEHFDLLNNLDDGHSFLLFNLKKYQSRYIIGLLLTFPILWINFSNQDWISLIQSNFPRKKRMREEHFKLINIDGEFTDLIFLQRYLKINPIYILLNFIKLESEELNNCIEFVKIYGDKFFISDFELKEDLKDFYNIGKNELDLYSLKLINQGFTKGFDTREKFEEYLNNI